MDQTLEANAIIPDQVTPVTGYKSLNIRTSYEKTFLVSPQQHTPWPQKTAFEAFCQHNKRERLSCQCGINSYKDLHGLSKSQYGGHDVYVQLAMWGEVQDCEWGYRSQYAYPTKIIFHKHKPTNEVKQELESRYGVPVEYQSPITPPKLSVKTLRKADKRPFWAKPAPSHYFRRFILFFCVAIMALFGLVAATGFYPKMNESWGYSEGRAKVMAKSLIEGKTIPTFEDTKGVAGAVGLTWFLSLIFVTGITAAIAFHLHSEELAAYMGALGLISLMAFMISSPVDMDSEKQSFGKGKNYISIFKTFDKDTTFKIDAGTVVPVDNKGALCVKETKCKKDKKLTKTQMAMLLDSFGLNQAKAYCKPVSQTNKHGLHIQGCRTKAGEVTLSWETVTPKTREETTPYKALLAKKE